MINIDAICDPLKLYDARQRRWYSVSRRVNQVANDDEACTAPQDCGSTTRIVLTQLCTPQFG
jgi:hypothetical protein